jgi:2-isopropylmalate synthase
MTAHHSSGQKGMPTAARKYHAYPQVDLSDRTWPSRQITEAPIWCSVDLRDGNQALVDPMGPIARHGCSVACSISASRKSKSDFPPPRKPISTLPAGASKRAMCPRMCRLQVLVQCRPELITRTFEALEGANKPIVHFYNSTSELQRRVVFQKDVAGIRQIAVDAAKMITDMAAKAAKGPGHGGYRFQYSPESFTGTELEVALEICNAVIAEIINRRPKTS